MRALYAAAVFCAFVTPSWAWPTAGEDPEFSEIEYACRGDDAEAFSGSAEAVKDACVRLGELLSEAKAQGMCWDTRTGSWHRCD